MTKIRMYLAVYGDKFNPDELTEITGILPTQAYSKGDIIPHYPARNKGIILRRVETSWDYSTDEIDSTDIDDVTKIIMEKFSDKTEAISLFAKENDLSVRLQFVIYVEKVQQADEDELDPEGSIMYSKEYLEKPAMNFSSDLIKFAYDLTADIDIDMYICI